MRNKRTAFSLLLTLTLVAAFIVGCGATPEPTAPPPEPTKAPAAPTEAPAPPSAEDLLEQVMSAGKLVVSTDPNYAPQSFLNDDGELDGFDINVAQEVAERLGVEVEFVTPDWDLITAGNWGGRWDVSIGSMTPTEQRSEILWFTDEYYFTPASFAVHKENTDITSVSDLTGKGLGLGTATTYESYLNEELSMLGGEIVYDPPPGIDIKAYSTDQEAIQDLALGDGVRLDAVMSSQLTIQGAIEEGVPLKHLGTPAFYEPLAFALDKSRGASDQMLTKLNEILADMHGDGTLTALSEEWYGLDITKVVEPTEAPAPPSAEDLLGQVMSAGKLVVSTDPNYAPQSFLDDDGELDGFDINVAQEVAERLGVEVEFVTPDWDLITAGNWGGRWDVSIGSMTPTEQRSEILWFTDEYYFTPASFAVHKENTDITSVSDLTGKSLGLGTATTYESYLNGELAMLGGEIVYDPTPGIDIKAYSTDQEAIQDLALGDGVRLDAVMSSQLTIQGAIEEGVPLKHLGTPAFYEPLAFALDKSRGASDQMLTKLNEILTDMHGDGTLTALSEEWYGLDITKVVEPTEAPAPPSAEDLLGQVMSAGKLVVSTDPNYAPQSFLDDDGELDGFDINVAQEVAERLGVEVEFVTPDWDLITAGNWGGRWDVSIGSMTPTEQRSEILWFTDEYYFTPASFAVHKENTDITSVSDLTGKSLGLGTATTYESYLNGELAMLGGEIVYDPPSGIDIKAYSTDQEAIQDLALGDGVRLDAVMSSQLTIQGAIEEGVPLKHLGTPAFYEPLAFALDKSRGASDQMLTKLNEILADMHGDGTLTALSEEWYGLDITKVVEPE